MTKTARLTPSAAGLRTLLRAVKTLIKQHPDEAPPGFREDFEAGKFFKAAVRAGRAEEELRVLDTALFPNRPTAENPVRRPQFHTEGWGHDLKIMDALHQLADVAIGLITRWNLPSFDGEIIIHHPPGLDMGGPAFRQYMADAPRGPSSGRKSSPSSRTGKRDDWRWISPDQERKGPVAGS